MAELGLAMGSLSSTAGLLAGLYDAINANTFAHGKSSDAGELARTALLESLSVQLRDRLPSLFEPTPQEIRKALGSFASGQSFATLARDFFAHLSYRSLDYYLSRELANHTGEGKRFADDASRTAFEHAFEASRIDEEFAGGWNGKTVWKERALSQDNSTTLRGMPSIR